MRTMLIAVIIAAIAFIALRFLVRALEPSMAFYPSRGEDRTPADWRVPFEAIEIPTRDGERIAAWWLPAADASVDVVYFHGNGGNLSVWCDVLVGIRARGWAVLAFDYRGYGRSTGRPSERGLYADADPLVDEYWTRRHANGRTV